jgi:hypothetical protein
MAQGVVMAGFSGGDKLQAYLEELAGNLAKGDALRVGFLEGATYKDGTSVAMVAAVQEFGGSISVPERTQDLEFKQAKNGEVKNRFVKRGKGNFVQTVTIPAHIITIPARPYFRTMLTEESPGWGKDMADTLKATSYDGNKTLALMGEKIKGQLQESIRNVDDPPNAASTIASKGFNQPLIDTGHMLNSVDFEVKS